MMKTMMMANKCTGCLFNFFSADKIIFRAIEKEKEKSQIPPHKIFNAERKMSANVSVDVVSGKSKTFRNIKLIVLFIKADLIDVHVWFGVEMVIGYSIAIETHV